MADRQMSGRKLLEAAKRVRARRLQEDGPGALPSDAELLAMIENEVAERKEAHRERMRRYYRERQASQGTPNVRRSKSERAVAEG